MVCRDLIFKFDPVKLSVWLLCSGLIVAYIAEDISKHYYNDYIYYIGLVIFGVCSVLAVQIYGGLFLALLSSSRQHELEDLGERIEIVEEEEK